MEQHDAMINALLTTIISDYSAKSKAPTATPTEGSSDLYVGALVYLKSDRSKSHARERYIIVSIDREWCCVKKYKL